MTMAGTVQKNLLRSLERRALVCFKWTFEGYGYSETFRQKMTCDVAEAMKRMIVFLDALVVISVQNEESSEDDELVPLRFKESLSEVVLVAHNGYKFDLRPIPLERVPTKRPRLGRGEKVMEIH